MTRRPDPTIPAVVRRKRRNFVELVDTDGNLHLLRPRQFAVGVPAAKGTRVLLAHLPGRAQGLWIAAEQLPPEPTRRPLPALALCGWLLVAAAVYLIVRSVT